MPFQHLPVGEPRDRFDVTEFLAAARPAWMAQAACADADHQLFFPGPNDPQGSAKEICATCPVRRTCLRYAIDNGLGNGIWGGMGERERNRYAKGSTGKPIAHGTTGGYQAHRRAGQPPCEECRAANNAYQASQRRSRSMAVAS